MEEMYKEIVKQLSLKDDVLYLQNKRYMLQSAGWLAELQKGLEKIMGIDGAALLLEGATRRMGQRLLANYAPQIKGKSFKEKIEYVLQMHTLTGWGMWELEDFQQSPPKIVLKDIRSYLGNAYEGKAETPRCYLQSGLVAIIEELAQSEGLTKLKGTETKCVAKSDPHCEFVFEPSQDG
jgi:predicted hydrocarbon binding protein